MFFIKRANYLKFYTHKLYFIPLNSTIGRQSIIDVEILKLHEFRHGKKVKKRHYPQEKKVK